MYAELVAQAEAHQVRARELQEQANDHAARGARYLDAAMALAALPEMTSVQPSQDETDRPPIESATADAPERDRVSSKEAVERILRSSPGWLTIAQVTERAVAERLLAGDFAANENRVKVATIRLERDGVLERRPGAGRAYEFRVASRASQMTIEEDATS